MFLINCALQIPFWEFIWGLIYTHHSLLLTVLTDNKSRTIVFIWEDKQNHCSELKVLPAELYAHSEEASEVETNCASHKERCKGVRHTGALRKHLTTHACHVALSDILCIDRAAAGWCSEL